MKEKIFREIVKHRKIIIIIFAVVTVISAIFSQFVEVNNDLTDYLPRSSPSTQAIDVMEEEFPELDDTLRVMVEGVSINDALRYKGEINQIEGISNVEWLDDEENIEQPIETMNPNTKKQYYIDEKALFIVTADVSTEEERDIMIEELRDAIGTEASIDGELLQEYELDQRTGPDLRRVLFLAVMFALIILSLTTSSWIEPILVLGTIGIAIVINNGTNYIFGEISFVTQNASSILQLAVSIDYSIFLLHRYEDYRAKGVEKEDSMVGALSSSLGSVASSGLTTIIGFAALTLMEFGIGNDMGIVLAKGVMFSLIAVFVFLPAVTLVLADLLEKTMHKPFVPSLAPFAKLIFKARFIMVPIIIFLTVPFFLAQRSNSFYFGNEQQLPEENYVREEKANIEEVFGRENTMALMVPSGEEHKEQALAHSFNQINEVNDIQSYINTVGSTVPLSFIPEETRELLYSEGLSRLVIQTELPEESDRTFQIIEQIREQSEEHYDEHYFLAGNSVSTYDLRDVIMEDQVIVNIASVGGILLVLIGAFKSFLIPVLLTICIQSAIWINLGIPYFADRTLFYVAFLILSTIQLGATVDYAVLLGDRYIEEREEKDKKEAMLAAIEHSGVSIFTSGIIMTVAGFLFSLFSTNQVVAQIGFLLGQGSILSMLIVFFVLPILLYTFDTWIQKTTLHTKFLN